MPEPLTFVEGIAAPIPVPNVDTDIIMPKRFLRTINRAGLAQGVVADWRFHEDGSERADYILNQQPYREAKILVVGDNFGCGSSREHAVWGLHQLGIRVLIGTSFAGIFYDNCRRNGVAAITVEADVRDALLSACANPGDATIAVDMLEQRIRHGVQNYAFSMPEDVRHDLIHGVDQIAATLDRLPAIERFEETYASQEL